MEESKEKKTPTSVDSQTPSDDLLKKSSVSAKQNAPTVLQKPTFPQSVNSSNANIHISAPVSAPQSSSPKVVSSNSQIPNLQKNISESKPVLDKNSNNISQAKNINIAPKKQEADTLTAQPKNELEKQINLKPFSAYFGNDKSNTIIKSEKVEVDEKEPKDKKKIFWTIFITVVSVMLVLSILLLVVFPRVTRPSNISIDFSTKGSIEPISSDSTIDGSSKVILMPGDDVGCTFLITSKKNSESGDVNLDVFVRIKIYAICDNNYYSDIIDVDFVDIGQWISGVDGYYYYQGSGSAVLSPNSTIETIKKIHFSKSIGNEFSGKSVSIVVCAEALQAQYQAIIEIWQTAPYEWSSQYKNLVF